MSKIILCIGSYAKTPYWIDRSELNLYSIEELCFYIRENVVLIDKEFMNTRLAEWVEQECKLPELGQELLNCMRQKASLTVFIDRILKAIHFCTEEEIKEINRQLLENADMNNWEKRKNRIDFYFKNGKYAVALREYEILRKELGNEDMKLAAKISYNVGTIYAHLFIFDMAADNYLRAYKEEEKAENFFAYLAAKRMQLSDQEYIDFVAQEVSHYDISLQLEKTIENLNLLWEESDDKNMLDELKEWRKSQRVKEYYDGIEQLISQQKDKYREHVLNSRGNFREGNLI